MPSNEVIGFIGLGVMGGPMCGHIAQGRQQGQGHDVDMSMVEAWAGDGVEAGTALSDVASAADIIFCLCRASRRSAPFPKDRRAGRVVPCRPARGAVPLL